MNSTMPEITILGKMTADLFLCQTYLGMVLLVPAGTIGNIISLIVFTRKTFRETAMGKYLIASTLCDLLFQVQTINLLIAKVFTERFCNFLAAINIGCMMFNGLIKSAISVDRMILVRFPTKFYFIKKTWFQLSVIAFLVCLVAIPVISTQSLIKYDAVRKNVRNCYVSTDPVSQFAITISRITDLYIGNILTFSCMLICGIIIIKKLSEMKAKSNKSQRSKKERVLTIYTIFCISYFLLMSTLYIGAIIYQLHFYNPLQLNELYLFLILLGIFLKNIEMNTSFYIFILFNKLYRSELRCIANKLLFIITRGRYGASNGAKKFQTNVTKIQIGKQSCNLFENGR